MDDLDLNDLNGQQRLILRDAVVRAFTRAQLNMLLSDADMPMLDIVAPPAAYEEQVFALIDDALRKGECDLLVAKVRGQNPGNPLVKTLINDLALVRTRKTEPKNSWIRKRPNKQIGATIYLGRFGEVDRYLLYTLVAVSAVIIIIVAIMSSGNSEPPFYYGPGGLY
jgi:hypothetical protein